MKKRKERERDRERETLLKTFKSSVSQLVNQLDIHTNKTLLKATLKSLIGF